MKLFQLLKVGKKVKSTKPHFRCGDRVEYKWNDDRIESITIATHDPETGHVIPYGEVQVNLREENCKLIELVADTMHHDEVVRWCDLLKYKQTIFQRDARPFEVFRLYHRCLTSQETEAIKKNINMLVATLNKQLGIVRAKHRGLIELLKI